MTERSLFLMNVGFQRTMDVFQKFILAVTGGMVLKMYDKDFKKCFALEQGCELLLAQKVSFF